NGKNMEIDIVAESSCGSVILVEVKKRQEKSGLKEVQDFHDKVEAYMQSVHEKTILPAFLSLGGFTHEAQLFCQSKGIGTAEAIQWLY
ncbi:MAG: hypothetical protein GY858_01115, partial [Candidatus Omnitrophica bacterium]|nr:hypothetical protein [Candidatus Omnitrophota bacterium]